MTSVRLNPTVAAIVVTRDRLPLLQQCLAGLRAQTRPCDEIVVVDNGSGDGTAQWLASQEGLTVLRQDNTGSSGGRFSGIRAAYERGHDWFWCLEDDAVPNPDALERLAAAPYFSDEWTGVLASLVLWTDGRPHLMNVPTVAEGETWLASVLADRCVRIVACSFVSVLFSRAAVARCGLPIRDFFIWYDDLEYTGRIAREFRNYLVLDSVAVHDTPQNVGTFPERVTPQTLSKYCFGARNYVAMVRRADQPLPRRARRILGFFLLNVHMVLRGRAPWRVFGWIARGLFMHVRVENV